MVILGVETSCDETSVALVKDGTEVIGELTASQVDLHREYGGIVPEVASREHLQTILSLIQKLLTDANYTVEQIDFLAVTVGPGLLGSLLVGINTAKTLAYLWDKPLIPVDHLLGHIYSNWLGGVEPKWPVLALVVSGGHTDLIFLKSHSDIQAVGGTRDDAVGEAFDKVAKILGLGYPGGPAIAKVAKAGNVPALPRPMAGEGLDMSYSGLKTAVLKIANDYSKENIAYEFQEAATDVLVGKTAAAIRQFKPTSLLLAGGVAANSVLRAKMQKLADKNNINYFQPELKYCADNAAMVAAAAYFLKSKQNNRWYNIKVSTSSILHQ